MDHGEFDRLYRREWPVLMSQVVLICGDRGEAADCVQEAFVRAWQHRDRLDSDAGGWLRTAAVRVAVSSWRKRRSAALAWTRLATHRRDEDVEAKAPFDVDEPLGRALLGLPVRQRQVVVMHHVMDMSVAQVADLLGVPDGSVRGWLSKGRASVLAALDAAAVETGDDVEVWR